MNTGRRNMKFRPMGCLISLLLLSALSPAHQQDRSAESSSTGAIEGIVLGENGEPAENAMINVQPEDTQLVGKTPAARSSTGGKFLLTGVPAGKNFLFVGNPKEGYPDTQFAVFTPKDLELVLVVVAAGKTTSNVTLRLPPKGGRIVGKIMDNETGAPVVTARIHLFQASAPERDISTSPTLEAKFEFVVPPIAYKMEVNAPHYKAWRFRQTGDSSSGDLLKVAPGATEQIIVRLTRE